MPKKSIPDEFSDFPVRLKQLMSKRKVIKNKRECPTSQQDLADKLGIKRQTVSLYLTGQSVPDALQIRKIAQFFNVSADWLLGLTNDPKRNPTAVDELKLSVEAAEILSQRCDNGVIEYDASDFINAVAESDYFPTLLNYYASSISLALIKREAERRHTLEPDEGKFTATDYFSDESYGAFETAIYDGAVYVPIAEAIRMYERSISDAVFLIVSETIDKRVEDVIKKNDEAKAQKEARGNG